jgi:hypothetical protein
VQNVREIPAEALRLNIGDFSISEKNGENAKSAPVSIVARSGQPVDHWYWGRVVHDFAGMKLAKNRIPIDYNHDAAEVIGYLNKFDASSGDLVTSGALVPYKENDRANEIIFKSRQGVPYEASIFFSSDGLVIEEVPEGRTAPVNGYQFQGPGAIFREWPLRGVAVCPYGYDANTETKLSAQGETVKVKFTTTEQAKENEMGAENENAEAEAKAKADESAKVQAEAEAKAKAEAEQLAAVEAKKKEEGSRFMASFGEVKGATYFAKGLKFEEAKEAFHAETLAEKEALAKEVTELKAKLAQVAGSGTTPAGQSLPAQDGQSGGKSFLDQAREFSAANKVGITAAMKHIARQDPAAYQRHCAGKK